MNCPMCSSRVEEGHPAHRGLVINAIASIQANLLINKANIAALKKKKFSKRFRTQHDQNLAHIAMLQQVIDRDEATLVGLKQFNSRSPVSTGA